MYIVHKSRFTCKYVHCTVYNITDYMSIVHKSRFTCKYVNCTVYNITHYMYIVHKNRFTCKYVHCTVYNITYYIIVCTLYINADLHVNMYIVQYTILHIISLYVHCT